MPRTMHHAAVSRSVRRTSGLTFFGKPVARRQHRQLAGEVVELPAQHVAEQHRRFVVEVVAGDDARRSRRRSRPCRTGGACSARTPSTARAASPWPRSGCRSRSRRAASTSIRCSPRARGERPGVVAGHVAVLADAEADVQPVGLVAEVEQQVPHREAVLAARHGDEHPVVAARASSKSLDGLGDLIAGTAPGSARRRSWRCGAAGR